MLIRLTKQSDRRHTLAVTRADGSSERVELESRSLLRHDLAHFAVETALSLRGGFWGSVARGAPLTGEGIEGREAALAETLAGPAQTLMRDDAGIGDYRALLERVLPERASDEAAASIHEQVRRLRGHWRATPFGGTMEIRWPAALC